MSFLRPKKLITIIICCFNHKKFLKECLNSLLKQRNYKNKFDIIFVDDKSQDNSLKFAKKILSKKKNCNIISNKKNIGLTRSCNKALKVVKTKYFIRVDSDDLVSKNFVYYFEREIKKNPDLVYCNRIEFTKNSKKIIKNKKKNIFKMISCGVAMKTKKVLKIGGYNSLKWEEYDLYLRYLKFNSKIKNINKNLYFYRKHKKSMSSNKVWLKEAWEELNKKYKIKFLNKFGSLKS